MKNLIKSLLFFVALISTDLYANHSINGVSEINSIENVVKVKTIKGSITLSGGCHVNYSITIDYDLFPPRVNSVHGTVTMSGNCSGTQTFRVSTQIDPKGIITDAEVINCGNEIIDSSEFKTAISKQLLGLNINE